MTNANRVLRQFRALDPCHMPPEPSQVNWERNNTASRSNGQKTSTEIEVVMSGCRGLVARGDVRASVAFDDCHMPYTSTT